MSLISVPCPACDQSDFAALYPSTIANPEQDAASYFSSSRVQAGYLPIVRCQTCGLVQEHPRDDPATLARVYDSLADGVYDSEDGNRLVDADAHLALVQAHHAAPAPLLDIGCATGLFAARAQAAGYQAAGIDASRWAIERARDRKSGAQFSHGSLESENFAPESYRIITLWDVLEHVHSPVEVLERVRQWLSPGGYLFLSLPNAASAVAKLMGKRWVLLLREHLWYFSPETMGRLLAKTGFTLVRTQPKWVSFSLANVAARTAQYPGPLAAVTGKLSRSPLLSRTPIRFPMGEMDVVALRK
jgi:2-polyprenyl-3-methyl-5-hydroxy-6-metoxy-1,4-benzoquinol methylase